MEDKIYKINHLNINESKTEFSLSYELGIKTFDIENFQEKERTSNNEFVLGSISLTVFLPETNFIIFVGSNKNKDYPDDNLVFFDIKKKEVLFSKKFENSITNVKYVNGFLFVCFGRELKILSYDNQNDLKEKELYQLDEEYMNLFEAWDEKENNKITKLFLAYPYKKDLTILFYEVDEWKIGNKKNISNPVHKIQNLFYIRKLNQLFISDENAIYIYGIDVDNGSIKICLKRGTNPGFITSMTLLNNNYLAINNLNRTIHIFDLDINNNAFSFSNIIYGMVYGLQEIYPCLRIYFKNLTSGKEGEFHKNDFNKKGALLVSKDDGNELNIIAYNGYAYKIRINFQDTKYDIISKVLFTEPKKDSKNLSLFNSYSEFDTNNK